MDTIQYNLPQSRIPQAWYNIIPHLPKPMAPVLHPGTLQPIGPDDLAPIFPMNLIMQEVSVERRGDLIEVELQASGFLYGMVRLVMGQLVALGEGRLSLEAFERRWRTGARDQVKEAAPPQGLCLLRVGYPEPVFPATAWYDCQPRFLLECPDAPPAAPVPPTPPPEGRPATR